VVNYRSDEAAATSVVESIVQAGSAAVAIRADVSSEAAVVALFEKIDEEAGLPPLTSLVKTRALLARVADTSTRRTSWRQRRQKTSTPSCLPTSSAH